jgi:hypothetical protein
LLAATGRHSDAAAMLIDAALLWQQVVGGWDPGDLRHLKNESAVIGQATFEQLVTAKVPPDLQESLTSGIESAEESAADE